jgi:hypothetical protein
MIPFTKEKKAHTDETCQRACAADEKRAFLELLVDLEMECKSHLVTHPVVTVILMICMILLLVLPRQLLEHLRAAMAWKGAYLGNPDELLKK